MLPWRRLHCGVETGDGVTDLDKGVSDLGVEAFDEGVAPLDVDEGLAGA